MRARLLTVMLGCLVLAQGGCGDEGTDAAAYTCGYMRDTVGTFREQAVELVDRAGLRANRLSSEEVVLDAEFQIRRACDGAADAFHPFKRVLDAGVPALITPGSAR